MKRQADLNTTMEHALVPEPGPRSKPGDTVDHNICPYFSAPRAADHDGDPEIFFSGVGGKTYEGKITGATTLNSPMQGMKTPSDPRK